jgi:hypothetical protein
VPGVTSGKTRKVFSPRTRLSPRIIASLCRMICAVLLTPDRNLTKTCFINGLVKAHEF